MNLNAEFFLYMTYLVTLVEVTLGLYMFVNNPRHPVSRNIALLLFVAALNSLGLGILNSAQNELQATLPTALLAFTTLSLQPLLIVTGISIFKPGKKIQASDRSISARTNPWKLWVTGALYFLAVLPLLFVVFDLTISTGLKTTLSEAGRFPAIYYSGIKPSFFPGGYLPLTTYTQGVLGESIRILYLVVFPAILLGMLLFFIVFDRSIMKKERWLAIVQLIVVVIATLLLFMRDEPGIAVVLMLISGILYAVAFSFSAFQQLQEPDIVQHGSLVTRIALLVLVVSLPLMVALVLYTSSRAGTLIASNASQALQQQSQSLGSNIETWLDLNYRILENLSLQSDIRSMDLVLQIPSLQAATDTFPYMNEISVSDISGYEIARSDNRDLKNNRARLWFRQAIAGKSEVHQILLGPNGLPVFVAAKSIQDPTGTVIGVIMFEAGLDEISQQLQAVSIGQTGTIFLVDDQNQLIAHPDPQIISWLRDYSNYPPVVAARTGQAGLINYLCSDPLCAVEDEPRSAFVALLLNDWVLVVEQSDAELFAPLRQVQQLAFIMLAIGLILFAGAVTYSVRRGLAPVKILTDTVAAIAEGDLDRQVPLESGQEFSTTDELGFLAHTFNTMTLQLKGLIGGLENLVEERTQDVKQRSAQLEAAAQVARASAAIRDLRSLLTQATQLISSTFGFYHTGIFIIDDAREYAVLQAANSEGGQKMLAQGHKLRVGQVGIVGFVASTAQPRIALDVGEDAVFFNNPDLPATRSEMALPLIVNEQVIGVLDVQSEQARAFQPQDLDVLQILADQLALAIENTRLLDETRRALQELQSIYTQRSRKDWQDRLRRGPVIFEYNRLGVEQQRVTSPIVEVSNETDPAAVMAPSSRSRPSNPPMHVLEVPITLRDHQIGAITFSRDINQPPWSEEEERVAQEAITQISAALENARLLEESQARSTQLRLLQEVTAVAASHTNLHELLLTVTQRLRSGLNLLHCGVILIDQQTWGSDVLPLTGTLIANDSADPEHPANQMIGGKITLFNQISEEPSVFESVLKEAKTRAVYTAQKTMPPGGLQDFVFQRGTATLFISPLVSNDEVIGFIVMDSIETDRYYSEEDLQLLDQLSLQISSAFEMASSFEQTTRRAEREKKTSEISSRIRETLDIDIILRTAAQEVRQLLGVPEVIVQLVNPEEETDESVQH